MGRIWVHLKKWWRAHFNGFTRRERWGYGVWLIFGVIVLVPELWAAFWKDSAPFPTISGTTADLEYGSPILGLVVVGVIVICLYSAMRFPPSKTGVLARQNPSPDDLPTYVGEDPFLPYRTPGGGRFTRSKTPVRELAAEIYFSVVFAVILVATTIAALVTGGTDEYAVGRTLYGSILVFWVVLPSAAAWPKRVAVDVPFPPLFETVRSLESRLRVLALVVVAGLVILILHLALYPWPSIIPDLQRTHHYYDCHPLPPAKAKPSDACTQLDDALVRPSPKAP